MDKFGASSSSYKPSDAIPHHSNPRHPKDEEGQNIKAVVRIRPMNDKEVQHKCKSVVNVLSRTELVCKDKRYKFDQIFKAASPQIDIYLYVVNPMVHDVLAGFNCTVFAYGQTGTGKTYTMTGGDRHSTSHWTEDQTAGCIPRAVANIFDEIESRENIIANVRVSYLELYCEDVHDLLTEQDDGKTLVIQESKGNVVVAGLQELSVFTAKDVYDLVERGNNRRKTATTLMNHKSSRSHTVFTISVHIRELSISGEELMRTGKLNLVDLAGSESAAKAGLANVKETGNINRSLLTLSRVIQKLAEKSTIHAPFRDSKLTRILKDSLGGRTKTCIIATVSPASTSLEETLNTLEYAIQARCIRNQPTINEKVSRQQMLKKMNDEMDVLRRELDAARSCKGFFVDPDNWNKLQSDVKNYTTALVTKESLIQEKERQLAELEVWKTLKIREFDDVVDNWKIMAAKMTRAKVVLKEQRVHLKQEKYVSQYYEEAAKTNASLLQQSEEEKKAKTILKEKLDKQSAVNYKNKQLVESSIPVLKSNMEKAVMTTEELKKYTEQQVAWVCQSIQDAILRSEDNHDELVENCLKKIIEEIENAKKKAVEAAGGTFNVAENLQEQVAQVAEEVTEDFQAAYDKLDQYEGATKVSHYEIMLTKRSKFLREQLDYVEQHIILLNRQRHDLLFEKEENDRLLELHKEDRAVLDTLIQEVKDALDVCHQKAVDKLTNTMTSCKKMFKLTSTLLNDAKQVIGDMCEAQKDKVLSHSQEMDIMRTNLAAMKIRIESLHTDLNTNLSATIDKSANVLKQYETVHHAGDTPQVSKVRPRTVAELVPREKVIEQFKQEFDEDKENNFSFLNISGGPAVLSCDAMSETNLSMVNNDGNENLDDE